MISLSYVISYVLLQFIIYCIQATVLVEDLGNFEPRDLAVKPGPGEGGKAHILREDQQNDVQQSESDYGMNMVCSDEISMSRSIPDTRPAE